MGPTRYNIALQETLFDIDIPLQSFSSAQTFILFEQR